MSKALRHLFPALLLSGIALQAASLRVCIEDRAGIGAPARAGLIRELNALLPQLSVDVEREGCSGLSGSDVLLSLLDERPGIPTDALGLAYRGNGVILPRLEVFVGPVMQLTQAGDWETLGRALARVAVHELLHYREQTDEHRAHGLRAARLSPAELVNEDLRPQLLSSLYHD